MGSLAIQPCKAMGLLAGPIAIQWYGICLAKSGECKQTILTQLAI